MSNGHLDCIDDAINDPDNSENLLAPNDPGDGLRPEFQARKVSYLPALANWRQRRAAEQRLARIRCLASDLSATDLERGAVEVERLALEMLLARSK